MTFALIERTLHIYEADNDALNAAYDVEKYDDIVISGGGGSADSALSMIQLMAEHPDKKVSIRFAHSAGTFWMLLKRTDLSQCFSLSAHGVGIDDTPRKTSWYNVESILRSMRVLARRHPKQMDKEVITKLRDIYVKVYAEADSFGIHPTRLWIDVPF